MKTGGVAKNTSTQLNSNSGKKDGSKMGQKKETEKSSNNSFTIPAMFKMQRKRNIEALQQSEDIEIIKEVSPSKYFKQEAGVSNQMARNQTMAKCESPAKRISLRLKMKRGHDCNFEKVDSSLDDQNKISSHDVKASSLFKPEVKNRKVNKDKLSLKRRKLEQNDEQPVSTSSNHSVILNSETELSKKPPPKSEGKVSTLRVCDTKETNIIHSIGNRSENDQKNITGKQQDSVNTTPTRLDSSCDDEGSAVVDENRRKMDKSSNTSDSPGPQMSVISKDESHQTEDQEKDQEFHMPYYLENFKLIIEAVLSDSFYNHLFIEEEFGIVEKFRTLEESEQKLFVRLYGRRHKWIRQAKIVYPKIEKDLSNVLQGLVNAGFILDETHLTDAEETLHNLPAPELRELAKSFKLNFSNQHRQQIVQQLLQHGKQNTIMNMFGGNKGGTAATVVKRAKSFLGKCYKVTPEVRAVFNRILTLFSLTTSATVQDEDSQGAQQQLFQLLMTNIGKIVYPSYTVNRTTTVFKTRTELLWYEEALQYENDIFNAMEQKDYTAARDIYLSAKDVFHKQSEDLKRHIQSLPSHLKNFSAGYLYTRVLSYGVEALQKLRLYSDAVDLLEALLGQEEYCQAYRGRWYDRLALNLGQHLKNPGKSLDVIAKGLADPLVRTGHRYALYQRAYRICTSPSGKQMKRRLEEFQHDHVKEAPKVYFEGVMMPYAKVGTGNYFISQESGAEGHPEDVVLCRVEQLALQHYSSKGYEEGIHGEMSTMLTLLGLFLWEEIFMNVTDVFHCPYQSFPLDLNTDSFYHNRKEAIDGKLCRIRGATLETLHNMLQNTWDDQYGKRAAHVNWEIFKDVDHAKGLVSCIGGEILAGIFQRIVRDIRNTTSGFPDLTVWSPASNKFKIVEVKGPNDRLSVKQILWLDYLLRLGVEAEVCHVSAVGAKRLQKPERADTEKPECEKFD
ncbi:fanconi-associated nuclease 1 [Lingula anatina]|uniref:Fanconi-associated nuclease n=1 Tax=Lingula anatina TaxID=7574 RepID=A0A1S3JTU7_LINAN|nr:fanconi-associated nuclease 1 [Lingula anatina]XP_013413517.1 fanconi-associated nuclease 1 [Lingula anatina]XP_013413518.1 fanconi-associated nuclease 1 [Lingula anatina]XP_013413519.1 fanconi-associated nuclease 1 [Lingula anatina]XP_013413520.1 fanconi-associated nuclease 1 [Lingula anatina]XP_013413521.1 fanconi-associated nuclease 1 [Lingula anatina]|eukprot:XP_013413515.1 fanconi-associated nuclease 1 [Lingula anatina]